MKESHKAKRTPVVAYCRFSSDAQREESIDAQLRAIRSYAEHNNMTIIGEYIDRARSATSDQRPEFQRMIRDAGEGTFSAVVVHKLDRFARNRYDSAHYRHQLKRCGVSIRSVVENLDDTPESIIMESVLEGMAEYYSKNLAREVLKGLTENALNGKHTGGIPALGYDVDPQTKHLVMNEREAETVRLIFQRASQGVGYGELIDELNRLGHTTKKGQVFSKNSLHSILRNPKYCGLLLFKRTCGRNIDGKRNMNKYRQDEDMIRVEGGVPAIVPQEQFDRVQEILSRRMQTRKHSHAKEVYLLTGKLVCTQCGGAYVGSRRHRSKKEGTIWVGYGCNRRHRTASKVCQNKAISRDQLEAFVLEKLSAYVFSERYIPQITAEYNLWLGEQNGEEAAAIKQYEARLRKLTADIDSTTNLLIRMQSDALMDKLTALEKDKKALELELSKLQKENRHTKVTEAEIGNVFAQIREALTAGTLQSVKQVIETYVQKIEVSYEQVRIIFNFFPDITLDTTAALAEEKDDEDCAVTQPSSTVLHQNIPTNRRTDESGSNGFTGSIHHTKPNNHINIKTRTAKRRVELHITGRAI